MWFLFLHSVRCSVVSGAPEILYKWSVGDFSKCFASSEAGFCVAEDDFDSEDTDFYPTHVICPNGFVRRLSHEQTKTASFEGNEFDYELIARNLYTLEISFCNGQARIPRKPYSPHFTEAKAYSREKFTFAQCADSARRVSYTIKLQLKSTHSFEAIEISDGPLEFPLTLVHPIEFHDGLENLLDRCNQLFNELGPTLRIFPIIH
jgi:hypothetical protein